MNVAGKSSGAPTFVGVIYNFGKAPEQSEPFSRIQEAKEWCCEHADYEDCLWVVLSNGIFEAGGLIDAIWEDSDKEDNWYENDYEEDDARL
jgi:hypothetical protein